MSSLAWGDLRPSTRADEASPFLKWAGGKGQLVPALRPHFPGLETGATYFEPFLGGGAVFFSIAPKRAVLSDKNRSLILTFQSVKEDLGLLLRTLADLPPPTKQEEYYSRRTEFNQLALRKGRVGPRSRSRLAALFIWLNHTCYNGLYRVNQKGQFNVPIGSYENPGIYSTENLTRAHKALVNAHARIECLDFSASLALAGEGDFVYLDPPYQPVSETARFTSYTKDGFDFSEQKRLAAAIHDAVKRGVRVVLSNSATGQIRSLYSNLKIETVKAPRAINCVGSRRAAVDEFVIVA